MSEGIIHYTHWAYFDDEAGARACAAELSEYRVLIDPPTTVREWLLRATREVEIDGLVKRHDEVADIVIKHGGSYDGGHSTYVDGKSVPDPADVPRETSTDKEA